MRCCTLKGRTVSFHLLSKIATLEHCHFLRLDQHRLFRTLQLVLGSTLLTQEAGQQTLDLAVRPISTISVGRVFLWLRLTLWRYPILCNRGITFSVRCAFFWFRLVLLWRHPVLHQQKFTFSVCTFFWVRVVLLWCQPILVLHVVRKFTFVVGWASFSFRLALWPVIGELMRNVAHNTVPGALLVRFLVTVLPFTPPILTRVTCCHTYLVLTGQNCWKNPTSCFPFGFFDVTMQLSTRAKQLSIIKQFTCTCASFDLAHQRELTW